MLSKVEKNHINKNTQDNSLNQEANRIPWLAPEFTDLAVQETLNAGGDAADAGLQES